MQLFAGALSGVHVMKEVMVAHRGVGGVGNECMYAKHGSRKKDGGMWVCHAELKQDSDNR